MVRTNIKHINVISSMGTFLIILFILLLLFGYRGDQFHYDNLFTRSIFKNFYNRSFDFNHKTKRKEFWQTYIIWCFLIAISYLTLVPASTSNPISYLAFLLLLFSIFFPSLAIQIRRLRDVGKSPGWVILNIVPGGTLILLYFYTKPSNAAFEVNNKSQTPLKDISRNQITQELKNTGKTKETKYLNSEMDEIELKLTRIKNMFERDLISQSEYESMKKKIIDI